MMDKIEIAGLVGFAAGVLIGFFIALLVGLVL
jgi:hypothetical protein